MPGHALGGIFTQPHVAAIAERGAEAIVPLNKSPDGFDIWKRAGELGGYLSQMNRQTATATAGGASPVMQAAARKISNNESENNIDIHFTQNITLSGTPGAETVKQISEAGRMAVDEFEERVERAMNGIMRNRARLSFG